MASVMRLCKNCVCFDAKTQECHKYAPKTVQAENQKKERWPVVQPINWCMEFEAKE